MGLNETRYLYCGGPILINASENGLESCRFVTKQEREGSHRLIIMAWQHTVPYLGELIHRPSHTCLNETFSDSVDNGLGSTVLIYLASIVA